MTREEKKMVEAEVREFQDLYPNYDFRFVANNPTTETEELLGLNMSPFFHFETEKTYQTFYLGYEYDALRHELLDKKTHILRITVNNKAADFMLTLTDDECILGVCLDTCERVAFADLPF